MTAPDKNNTSQRWYAEGLRFECRRCGDCCRGEPGYVWVTRDEIRRMASHLGLSPEEFAEMYVRRVGFRRSLTERPNGDCVLWAGQDRGCLVYPVRPIQCRTFPFWRQILRSQRTWARTSRRCPGMDRGRHYSREEIDERRGKKF